MVDGEHRRRFDIVLYINGMPLGFIELKKAGDDSDDLKDATTSSRRTRRSFRWRSAAMWRVW